MISGTETVILRNTVSANRAHQTMEMQMALKTYEATVRFPSTGTSQKVTVQADNLNNAKAMIEAQYGKGNITFGPMSKN